MKKGNHSYYQTLCKNRGGKIKCRHYIRVYRDGKLTTVSKDHNQNCKLKTKRADERIRLIRNEELSIKTINPTISIKKSIKEEDYSNLIEKPGCFNAGKAIDDIIRKVEEMKKLKKSKKSSILVKELN